MQNTSDENILEMFMLSQLLHYFKNTLNFLGKTWHNFDKKNPTHFIRVIVTINSISPKNIISYKFYKVLNY